MTTAKSDDQFRFQYSKQSSLWEDRYLPHTISLSLTHSRFLTPSLSLTHSLTHSFSLSLTHSHSFSLSLSFFRRDFVSVKSANGKTNKCLTKGLQITNDKDSFNLLNIIFLKHFFWISLPLVVNSNVLSYNNGTYYVPI